jgi:4-azaleucine resistance transporter AzlC
MTPQRDASAHAAAQSPQRSRRREFADGVAAEMPLLAGVAPFGLAYGAYAVESGISSALATAMSFVVFGGASQIVGVEQMSAGAPGVIVVLTAFLVNLRHVLYGASLAPHVEHASVRFRWLIAYLLTDEAYAVGIERYRRPDTSPHRHFFVLGAGVALWACWQVTTVIGVVAGAAVPERWALDFALPLTFLAIVVPAMRDRRAVAAALVAGAVAVAAHGWPYGTGLLAAATAGIAAGMLASRAVDGAPPDDGVGR